MSTIWDCSPPFVGADSKATCNHILQGIERVHWPKYLSLEAVDLIRNLCKPVDKERLGYASAEEIRRSAWFTAFSFYSLRNRYMRPPYTPEVCFAINLHKFAFWYTFKCYSDAWKSPKQNSTELKLSPFTFKQTAAHTTCFWEKKWLAKQKEEEEGRNPFPKHWNHRIIGTCDHVKRECFEISLKLRDPRIRGLSL